MKRFITKWEKGRSIIAGGSRGCLFSLVLASKSSKLSGCGMVVNLVPKDVLSSLETINPFCKIIPLVFKNIYKDKFYNDLFKHSQSLLFGVGSDLWSDRIKNRFIHYILREQTHLSLVIDAAGVTESMIKHIRLRNTKEQNVIIIANTMEAKRVLGMNLNNRRFIDFVRENNCYFLHKENPFILLSPLGEIKRINVKSIPEMATQGMGDILSGFLTGLLSRGFILENAVEISVIVRQKAGEIFIEENKGFLSITPERLLDYFPKAINFLKDSKIFKIIDWSNFSS